MSAGQKAVTITAQQQAKVDNVTIRHSARPFKPEEDFNKELARQLKLGQHGTRCESLNILLECTVEKGCNADLLITPR